MTVYEKWRNGDIRNSFEKSVDGAEAGSCRLAAWRVEIPTNGH